MLLRSYRRIHLNLTDACNSQCNCNEYKFDPVCGADNVMYYSPCYAGCFEEYTIGDAKVGNIIISKSARRQVSILLLQLYANCSCVINQDGSSLYDASNSTCGSTCNKLWLFILLAFGCFLFTFLGTMPALTATLRFCNRYAEFFKFCHCV